MRLNNREDLEKKRIEAKEAMKKPSHRILVCAGTGCLAGGSAEIYNKFLELAAKEEGVEVEFGEEAAHGANDRGIAHTGVKRSGCHGFCEMGPLVRIEPSNYLYVKVKEEDCEEIFEETIRNDRPVERLLYEADGVKYETQEKIPFYEKQMRLVLKNCGHIDAENMDEYIAVGGYQALEKVLFEMTPEDVVEEISESGLRGRGGGGFQTGYKWRQVARQKTEEKYIVCNGDEGDPGAFMDRSVMEGDPHKMLEGMMIAGYAVGASEGYIYVRAEYPLAINRLKTAIAQASEAGLLGEHILGTDFSFRIHINRGAGAFVCGEGSALTASIEGERGMPRTKPPRTVEQGLFAKPTVLNNVETYANVPMIVNEGAAWYHTIGTEGSPGTKAFALTGSVKHTGLIEVPMGTTLRKIVYDIGGGTGSVAVEIARLSDEIQVYAVEQKEEAVSLMARNKEKFGLQNIHLVKAAAPEGLSGLPMPTQAFIGGSGGRLKEIMAALWEKNKNLRIVITAVSMETLCEIKEILTLYQMKEEETVQLQVSRVRKAGGYQLMQAENPVWICAFTFDGDKAE